MEDMEITMDYTVSNESIDGDTAVVDLEITGEMTMAELGSMPLDQSMSIDLVKEDGKWLICDPDAGNFM